MDNYNLATQQTCFLKSVESWPMSLDTAAIEKIKKNCEIKYKSENLVLNQINR